MIRFACPRCSKQYTVAFSKAGKKTNCPACGQRLQVPSPPRNKTVLAPLVTEQTASTLAAGVGPPEPPGPFESITEPADRPPQQRRRLGRPIILGVGLLGAACLAAILLGVPKHFPPLSNLSGFIGRPTTCKELVKQLESGGMSIRWVARTESSIYILPSDNPIVSSALDDIRESGQMGKYHVIFVNQYPTDEEASRATGTLHDGAYLLYGPFVITGDPKMLAEIRARI